MDGDDFSFDYLFNQTILPEIMISILFFTFAAPVRHYRMPMITVCCLSVVTPDDHDVMQHHHDACLQQVHTFCID